MFGERGKKLDLDLDLNSLRLSLPPYYYYNTSNSDARPFEKGRGEKWT